MSRRYFLLAAACCLALSMPAVARASQDNGGRYPVPERPNGYYYYLVSQLKSFEQDDRAVNEFLGKALEVAPDSGFLWNQKAYLDAKLGDLANALKDAQTSLAKDPDNVDSLVLMGKIQSVQQKIPAALAYYDRALAKDPKNEEAYNLKARDQLTLDNKPAALVTLQQCLQNLPESLSCLYYIGSVHLESNNLDQALRYFNLLVELNPDQSRVLNTIGEIHLKKGQYQKALEMFHQLADQNPSDLVSQVRVGLLYYQLKDLDNAIREFSRIARRFPKADKVNYFLGLMHLERGDGDKAYAYFDRVATDSSFFQESFNRQLLILKQSGKIAKALALAENKLDHKKVEYWQTRAAVELMMSDYQAALATLNTALKKFKTDGRLKFQRAVTFDKLGKWESSKADLEDIIAVGNATAEIYNYIGYGMLEHGDDLKAALAYVEKAVAISPDEGHIIDSQAWIYFKMNQTQKALTLLIKANKLEPNEPTILEHLGDVTAALRDKKRARTYYQASLKILNAVASKKPDEVKQIDGIKKKLAET